jgi:molybdopterin-binding protein
VVVEKDYELARVRVGSATVEVGSALDVGTPVHVCVRPEDVTLLRDVAGREIAPSSARNRLLGRVTGLAPWGGQVRVTLDCGFPLIATVTRRSAAELGLKVGEAIVASFKATSAHLIRRVEARADAELSDAPSR